MKKFFLIVMFCSVTSFAQKTIELFPDNLTIQPFTANMLEPKLGFMFKTAGNELALNIGNSIDLIRISEENDTYSVGADLFTWTLLRKENNFHFPVDAVDYLFGLNFSFKTVVHDYALGVRARISHISAHFVDGHFDLSKYGWRTDQGPRVYSREFIEIMPFYKWRNFRFYAGVTYLFHVDPELVSKYNYQVGFDYYMKNNIYSNITPFFGYDLNMVKVDDRIANHSFSLGVKFGKPEGKGLKLFYNYFSGNSIQGEYFDYKEKYSSIGLNLDL